ncbi:hypothetical protein [Neptuniibacter halophilus]|uniref:hypothetical protein n=1 Tax=Neptuniibacter halophilus TaxID=651666 RepID=UPI002572BB4A|nr:hypothetical protein [Neptuniibacter halophilus]
MKTESIMRLSLALLFLTLAAVIGGLGYLTATDPQFNHIIRSDLDLKQQQHDRVSLELTKKWKWLAYNDVAVSDERYPMVLMRSGYKVLKVKDGKALVGWQYEVMNTSPKTNYVATISLDLTDRDGFKIAGSSKSGKVLKGSFSQIKDTIEIDSDDIDRLSNTDWTISLSGDWKASEKNTPKTRYERFVELVLNNEAPWWIYEEYGADEPPEAAKFYDKWLMVVQALRIKAGKEQI